MADQSIAQGEGREKEIPPSDPYFVGRQKFAAKFTPSSISDPEELRGYMDAWNCKGVDGYLRACEADGVDPYSAMEVLG